MIPFMMIWLHGVLAVPGTPLTDEDEVDLIPDTACFFGQPNRGRLGRKQELKCRF
jgi:hypothetical protein